MTKSPTSSWSENASTLPPPSPGSDDSDSWYSSSEDSSTGQLCSPFADNESPWIIDHILQHRPHVRLPLRIMFSFNSGHLLPNLKADYEWWNLGKDGQKIIKFLSSLGEPGIATPTFPIATPLDPTAKLANDYSLLHCPSDRFMDEGNADLITAVSRQDSLPSTRRASNGLPPNFVEKMLHTIFQPDFGSCDFKQALTGLDYLSNFEDTRRCHLQEAAQRLGITNSNWREVLRNNIGALEWIECVLEKEAQVEGHYNRLFVNLRIWIMISELAEPDFYKPSVLAMLNTLFPPGFDDVSQQPVKAQILHKHRASLYRCMMGIEAQREFQYKGRWPPTLDSYVNRFMRIGTGYSWKETTEELESYTKLAGAMIQQAKLIQGPDFFKSHPSPYVTTSHSEEFSRGIPKSSFSPVKVQSYGKNFDQLDSSNQWIRGHSRSKAVIPLSALLIDGASGHQARHKARHSRHHSDLDLIPERVSPRLVISPVARSKLQGLSQTPRPRFRARRHSDSTLLPELRLLEHATPTSSLFTIQSSELRAFITNALASLLTQPPKFGPSTRAFARVTHKSSTKRIRVSQVSIDGTNLQPSVQKFRGCVDGKTFTPTLDALPASVDKQNDAKHLKAALLTKKIPTNSRRSRDESTKQPFVHQKLSTVSQQKIELPKDDLEFLSRPYSQASSRPSPPKLKHKGSFRDIFYGGKIAKDEATAYVDERFPSFDSHRTKSTPTLSKKSSKHQLGFEPLSLPNRPKTARRPSTPHEGSGINTRQTPVERNEFDKLSRGTKQEAPGSFGSKMAISPMKKSRKSSTEQPGPRSAPLLHKQSSFVLGERLEKSYSPLTQKFSNTSLPFQRDPEELEGLLGQERQPLRKQRSLGFLRGMKGGNALHAPPSMPRVPPPSSPYTPAISPSFVSNILPRSSEAASRKTLKKKNSVPTLAFRTQQTRPSVLGGNHTQLRANDPYQRLDSRPVTPSGETKMNDSAISRAQTPPLRSVKSAMSLRKKASSSSLLAGSRSIFKKEKVITSVDISEPFPNSLQSNLTIHENQSVPNLPTAKPTYWASGPPTPLSHIYPPLTTEDPEDFIQKEYTRRWLIENGRAERFDLKRPKGTPWKSEKDLKGPRKWWGGRGERGEMDDGWPYAEQKELVRPERTKMDGIFGLKYPRKKEKKSGYTAMDVSKFERY